MVLGTTCSICGYKREHAPAPQQEPTPKVASPELTAEIDAAAKAGRFIFEPGWNEPPAPKVPEGHTDHGQGSPACNSKENGNG